VGNFPHFFRLITPPPPPTPSGVGLTYCKKQWEDPLHLKKSGK
jgi:hypothetical protein